MTVWRVAVLRLAGAYLVCAIISGSNAAAQVLPSEPLEFADGRVTVSGLVSATAATPKDQGFFNFTDYDISALRMLRIDVSAAAHAGPHFAVLTEIRKENDQPVRPYALFLRMRPWTTRNFDIQVGMIPPTFGAFARRTYPNDNPLIGYPLAYQYLTTLRSDAVPGDADELLQKQSTGWLVRYRYGNQALASGVPLASAFRWDTGVQVHGGTDRITGTLAVTRGTIAHPLFTDDNSGRQVVGRLELRPVAGLVIGTSMAHGPFVSEIAARGAIGEGHAREFTQTAWGGDVEYSRHHYLVRFETIVSDWRLPLVGQPAQHLPLRAVATSTEGRYKFAPGFYVAARYDDLSFSEITGALRQGPWDAPVSRAEAGVGISLQRNLLLKIAAQRNRRDLGRLQHEFIPAAAQLVFWF
jgi:hypothetical protein